VRKVESSSYNPDVLAARSVSEEAWSDSPPSPPCRPGQEPKKEDIQLFAPVGMDISLLGLFSVFLFSLFSGKRYPLKG
jgi:hypothetical protein